MVREVIGRPRGTSQPIRAGKISIKSGEKGEKTGRRVEKATTGGKKKRRRADCKSGKTL